VALVCHPRNKWSFAVGDLAILQGAGAVPISVVISAKRATPENRQRATAQRVALKMTTYFGDSTLDDAQKVVGAAFHGNCGFPSNCAAAQKTAPPTQSVKIPIACGKNTASLASWQRSPLGVANRFRRLSPHWPPCLP
jgi:hypothetical protein